MIQNDSLSLIALIIGPFDGVQLSRNHTMSLGFLAPRAYFATPTPSHSLEPEGTSAVTLSGLGEEHERDALGSARDPVAGSHSLSVLSQLPESTRSPSGEN